MNVWMNRQTGDLVLACPIWEPLTFDEKFYDYPALGLKLIVGGTLFQRGWLIENQHGVWMSSSILARYAYEDLGEA